VAAAKASVSERQYVKRRTMAVSAEYRDHLQEIFGPLGPVSVRRMFGGVGVFYAEVMFALATGDEVYLKVDEVNKPDFEAAGMCAFSYMRGGEPRQLGSYLAMPEALFDEPDELLIWARGSVDAALRNAKTKPKKKRKPKKT